MRPKVVLEVVMIQSILNMLRFTSNSHFHIAKSHNLADEKALNSYMNYHLGLSPSRCKVLSDEDTKRLIDSFCHNRGIKHIPQ